MNQLTLSFILVFLSPFPIYAQETQPTLAPVINTEGCFDCHNDATLTRDSDGSSLHVPPDALRGSVHEDLSCRECHGDASDDHPSTLKKVVCGGCHVEADVFVKSDHGRAIIQYTGDHNQKLCSHCHEENAHKIMAHNKEGSKVHRYRIALVCASCHEDEKFLEKFKLIELHPYQSFQATVHGQNNAQKNGKAATCTDCHGAHNNQRRWNQDSNLAPQNVSKTCGKCHQEAFEQYEKSLHGVAARQGMREAPLCITCHGEHSIYSVKDEKSRVYKTSISSNCASCHASERIARKFNLPIDRLSSYRMTFHGTMDVYGSLEVANCASCHGSHLILPSSDPHSSTHPTQLSKTCGQCHPGAGDKLSLGKIHLNPYHANEGVIYWVRTIYIVLIIITIGFMFFHNLIDFRKKLRFHYRKSLRESIHLRLNLFERVQHFLLAFSFIGLAVTGFAIAYPDSWIAYPFRLWGGGAEFRWWAHRVFAGVMTLVIFLHLFYALFTSKGRKEIRGFMPKLRDLKDMFGLMAYNLGIRKKRPLLGHQNYIEKMEYLALVWGTIIMFVSGAVLLLDRLSLKFLPMVVINVSTLVHLYEAILATLAILVWHMYFVIFDPDEYPMNWTWRTGKLTKHQQEMMHGRESAENKDQLQ